MLKHYYREGTVLAGLVFFLMAASALYADVNVSILAVNGTDTAKEKEITYQLPKEVTADDIIDTDGLEVDYDVNQGAYFVHGKINLAPKESKTLKVRLKDIWRFEPTEFEKIRQQISDSVKRLEGTENYDMAVLKKQSLNQRLDFILEQQAEAADNTQKRIDRYRIYSDEVNQIETDSMSVKYWRSKPADIDRSKTVKLIIEVENPSADKSLKLSPQHYLPTEVKPEHFVNLEGFEVAYDTDKRQAYLTKEEELKPSEKKRYELNIIDMWHIPQADIDNVKDRTRKTYKLLENTEYAESAKVLVANIKDNLDKIEASQAQPKEIKQHINAFRTNQRLLEYAQRDLRTLEEWLEAVRENLERSKLKNVLQRIKTFQSLTSIAEAVFGTKPAISNFWRIIIGIIIFVGIFSTIHFVIWGKRSKDIKAEIKKEEPKTT